MAAGAGVFQVDPAFRIVNRQHCGFYVWRVENLQVVPVPRESVGKFFNGDAYIIYSSTAYGQAGGPSVQRKESRGGRMEQHIHFWLGAQSSQDEAGVAAFKSVELDEYLGGGPIQSREVQGHESKRFRAYFKEGIRILQGGVASGFNHVVEDTSPKMYIVKGKRQPILRQLADISWSAMNHGDTFILDVRSHIFVWTGKDSNRMERLQASKSAQKIKEENGGGTIVNVNDGEEGSLEADEKETLEAFLPMAKKQQVKPSEAVEPDEHEDIRVRKEIRLYRCSDQDGTLKVSEVKTGPLLQADLVSDDSFIVDNGSWGIWVWVGKRASKKERTEAMRNAQGFIKKKGYQAHTNVSRVVDGAEPMEFKALFKAWRDKYETTGVGKKYSVGRGVAKVVQVKFDAKTLHERPEVAAEARMVDDGSGTKETFRVENFDLVQVDEEDENNFYSGDAYVVLYAFHNGTRDSYMIYYWLGSHCSQDEQGTAALKAVELDERLGGGPVQVRVVQGKEPPHFLAIFGGNFTVFAGGVASAFDDVKRSVEVGSTYLLQIHGRTRLSTKAVQVPFSAASLNTNDCFVMKTQRETYVWMGKGSKGDERETAKQLASQTDRDPVIVFEGQEKNDFWSQLGGKEPYIDEKVIIDVGEEQEPRLFHGSNASGNFKLEEVLNFVQQDLVAEDVMLLDVGDSLFVWLGIHSNQQEKSAALESAKEYLEYDPSGRDRDIAISVVKQGHEPPHFTGFFGAWDRELFKEAEHVVANAVVEKHMNGSASATPGKSAGTSMANGVRSYRYEVLKGSEVPPDVDVSEKEKHLSEQDFESVFQMNKGSFDELPKWRRTSLKKQAGLF